MPHSTSLFTRLWREQRGLCHYCGRQMIRGNRRTRIAMSAAQEDALATKDHVLPKSKGGRGNPENIVLACAHCNRWKGAQYPFDGAVTE